MNGSPNISLIISVVLLFGVVFFLIASLMKFVKRDELQVEKRKNKIFQQRRTLGKPMEEDQNVQKKSGYLERISKLGITKVIGNELLDAEIMVRPEEFLGMWIALGLCLPLLTMLLLRNFISGFIVLLLCAILPLLFLKTRKGKKMERFDDQLSDALLTISNCLTAGLSFQQAMENIAREMPDPIANEFGRVVKEMRLGKTTEKALGDMMERIPSKDLSIALNAVLIQHQVGGNLSEILESIAETIEDRHRVRKEIKVLTAQGKMSGVIVGLLPVFLGVILLILNPSYMVPFFTSPIGIVAIVIAVVMELIGVLLIKKIVTIEY